MNFISIAIYFQGVSLSMIQSAKSVCYIFHQSRIQRIQNVVKIRKRRGLPQEQENLGACCRAAAQKVELGLYRGHGHTDPRSQSGGWRASAFTWTACPCFSAVEAL